MKRKKFKVRPVDMCIYIDNHIYEPDHDVELIFEYLQDLYYSIAMKKRFFSTQKDYDSYSLYCATQVYMRLTNKKQFLEEDNNKKLPKIKSVLNYIKSTLYPLKVNYQNSTFNEVVDSSMLDMEAKDMEDEMSRSIRSDSAKQLSTDVEYYFSSLPRTIKSILKDSPYNNNNLFMHNLYMSCLITLLKSVTLSNENINRLYGKDSDEIKNNVDSLIDKIYYEEMSTATTAWHLDKCQEPYINVLVNKIKKIISSDIKSLARYYEPSDELIKDMLMEPLADYQENSGD